VCSSGANLRRHHHLNELLVVDLTITIDISLTNHLIDLIIGELLAEVRHDVTELSSGDVTVAILVEDLESLLDFLLRVCVLHLASHHGQELSEVDRAVTIGVDLIDHILQLSLGGVLTERSHHGTELLCGDVAIIVLVEKRERFLELNDLLLREVLGDILHATYQQIRFNSNVRYASLGWVTIHLGA